MTADEDVVVCSGCGFPAGSGMCLRLDHDEGEDRTTEREFEPEQCGACQGRGGSPWYDLTGAPCWEPCATCGGEGVSCRWNGRPSPVERVGIGEEGTTELWGSLDDDPPPLLPEQFYVYRINLTVGEMYEAGLITGDELAHILDSPE